MTKVLPRALVEAVTRDLRSPHSLGVRSALSVGKAFYIREKRVHPMSPNIKQMRSRWATVGVASTTVLAGVAFSIVAGGGALADSTPSPVTRAALDPALVAGRGANVAFSEQEAEKAATNGTVITGRDAYTLPSEASGRSAVSLTAGQYVEFTLPKSTNAITVRYSIPDAPTGGGITSPLDVTVNGKAKRTMTLTSHYAYLYNLYPFSNDPTATILHPDWWVTECQCVPQFTSPTPVFPTPYRPMHFYDEQRMLLGKTYKAGDKIRLTVPAGAATTIVDLLDSELVGAPKIDVIAANRSEER